MGTGRRVAAAAATLVVLAVGYEALDVYDVVPGPLTLSGVARPVPEPGSTRVGPSVPPPTPVSAAPLRAADGPPQVAAAVRARVAAALEQPDLADRFAVQVLDGRTGQSGLAEKASRPKD